MIAIVDPALLLTDTAEGPLGQEEEKALADLVDDVARVCRDHRASIPAADWYWRKLQADVVRPLLSRTREPRLKRGIDNLRAHTRSLTLAGTPPAGTTRLWGVRSLFQWPRLSAEWLTIMERLLIGCAQLDEPTVLVARLFPGRNLEQRAAGGSTLDVKTRWRLYLHVPGRAPCHVPCVRGPRNVAVPWTARFDEKLPDAGHYPFCPPARWWRRDVKTHGTVRSKPAWVDRHGSGWAQPATGGAYHWDVFIESPGLCENVGLNAINVVAWGTTEQGKIPGEIHHVPKDKKGRFQGGGWDCNDKL